MFTTRSGRAVEPRNLSRSFDRIVTATDLPNIVFHDLRRTAATMLKSLGVPARDAQAILGHANLAVTLGVYSEVFDTEIAAALSRINDALGEESTGGAANGEEANDDPRHPLDGGSSAEEVDDRRHAPALMSTTDVKRPLPRSGEAVFAGGRYWD